MTIHQIVESILVMGVVALAAVIAWSSWSARRQRTILHSVAEAVDVVRPSMPSLSPSVGDIAFHWRMLSLREDVLGPDHPDVATTLNILGSMYVALGKRAEADALLKRSLRVRERALGQDHVEVAATMADLAALYETEGRLVESETLYRRVLDILRRSLGASHPDVAETLRSLARICRGLDRPSEAASLMSQVIEIEQSRGTVSKGRLASELTELAGIFREQEDPTAARQVLNRALTIADSDSPTTDGVHLEILSERGRLQMQEGRAHDAEISFRSVLATQESGPSDHAALATTLVDLAASLEAQNRSVEAISALERALAVAEGGLGAMHPLVARIVTRLSRSCASSGDQVRAQALLRRMSTERSDAVIVDEPIVGEVISFDARAGLVDTDADAQRRVTPEPPAQPRSVDAQVPTSPDTSAKHESESAPDTEHAGPTVPSLYAQALKARRSARRSMPRDDR